MILMTLVAMAGAGIVATILVANPSAPKRTQPVSVTRDLRDDNAVAVAKLERASQSLSRLLEIVEAVKAEHERERAILKASRQPWSRPCHPPYAWRIHSRWHNMARYSVSRSIEPSICVRMPFARCA
jgi:hypothetical protein